MTEKQEKGGKSGFSIGEKESADAELRRLLSRGQRERDRAHRQQLIANETPEESHAWPRIEDFQLRGHSCVNNVQHCLCHF